MDIHKPKPFHDWHEFLSEILIVVLGVSIALGAEQAIEAWHWHHKIETIEDAMQAELVGDDLPQAYARIAIARCLGGQLDALQALAKPGTDGARFSSLAADYVPPYRTWDSFGLSLAQQSDLSSHMSASRMSVWNTAYSAMPMMSRTQDRELDAVQRLRHSRFRGRPLTQADADDINDTIDDLRSLNRSLLGGSKILLAASENGPKLAISDAVQKSLLADAHRVYGDCVVTPDWTLPSDRQIFTKEERQRVGS